MRAPRAPTLRERELSRPHRHHSGTLNGTDFAVAGLALKYRLGDANPAVKWTDRATQRYALPLLAQSLTQAREFTASRSHLFSTFLIPGIRLLCNVLRLIGRISHRPRLHRPPPILKLVFKRGWRYSQTRAVPRRV